MLVVVSLLTAAVVVLLAVVALRPREPALDVDADALPQMRLFDRLQLRWAFSQARRAHRREMRRELYELVRALRGGRAFIKRIRVNGETHTATITFDFGPPLLLKGVSSSRIKALVGYCRQTHDVKITESYQTREGRQRLVFAYEGGVLFVEADEVLIVKD